MCRRQIMYRTPPAGTRVARLEFSALRTRLCLLSLLMLPVASHGAEQSPYLVPKKEFAKTVKSIALAPLEVPAMFALRPGLRAAIETEATRALQRKKFKLTEIEAYAEIRTLFAQRIGGLHNAQGELDPQRHAAVLDHAKREMRLRYPVDAFAEITLRPVRAVFSDDRAEWDGTKQKVEHSGDEFSLFGGKNYQGSIAAISFQLAIFDRTDKLLFVSRAGVEVMQQRQGTRLVVIPAEQLLQNEKQVLKAVKSAFKKL